MSRYRFVNSWLIEADRETLWRAIEDIEEGGWWPGGSWSKIRDGREDGLGDVYRSEFRAGPLYSLSFEAAIVRRAKPWLLELAASGELEGRGTCSFRERDGRTEVHFIWEVRVNKSWMRLAAPLLRRFFVRNHDRLMERGVRGVCRHLGVRLAGGGPA